MKNIDSDERPMTNRIIYLLIEIAFVFAVPAVLATIFGPRLDSLMGTEKIYSVILILLALVLSWTIVIVRYKKLSKKVREKKERKKQLEGQNRE